MASGSIQSTTLPPPPPVPLESRERERIIRRQLARTGLQVRLVDLASSLAIWVIGVVVLFLLMALVDHFLGLGRVGRCLALAVLLGGSLWYLVMQVGPLLVRTINPAYAARTIEETRPTLKNSLINFLLLRNDKSGLKEIVYQAVERQAAADIATVNVETTVDRSRLIYTGYVLCGVMALLAAYKILSPKDPFQTVARVLAPWADIARPSRVQISDVQPGSTEVYHGQTVRISATIRGAREGERIAVLYSTVDGQTVDQPIAMKLSAGDHYECDLPAESGASAAASGLLQNTTYRIVAGDAETFSYRLNVISAPTIVVDRLDFQFPGYTKKAPESVAQQGDIKALEGTRVTVHGAANQPIKSAWIEFDPAANEAAAETAPLIADGERARGTITLQLKPDRQTPWHTTYQARYYNERGQRSQQPILHRIEVLRDLAPEVQILKPERLRVEVPEDGEQTIEVRAVDPDFGLASLRIEGAVNGKPPVSIDLLKDAANQPPQITVPLSFRPREHHLKAGDEFHYVAVADDNRTNPQTGQPEPNSTRTKEYTFVITAPRNSDGGQGGQGGADQKPKPDGKNQNQPAKGQQKAEPKAKQDPKNQEQPQQPMKDDGQKNQKNQSGKEEQQKNQQQQQDGQKGDQQGKQQNNQQSGDNSKQGDQQSGDQKSGDQQKSDQQNQSQSGGQQQGGEQQSGQKQDGQQQGGQSGDAQQSNQSGGGQKGQSGSKSGNDASQQADPTGGGQASDSAAQGGKGGKPSGNSQQTGGQAGDQKGEPAGDQGKAQHDGQAIERVLKEMQKRGDGQKKGDQSQEEAGKPQTGEKQTGDEQRGENTAGDKAKGQSPPGSKENGDKTQQPGGEQGGKPQAAGASGAGGKGNSNTGTPEPNDQQPKAKSDGQAGKSKSDKTGDRLPDERQGQDPSEQPSGGSKGGESHGGSKTDKGEKSPSNEAQQRDAGAGKTGEEGAGQASEDKSGSGDGDFKNRDHNKEQKPDSNQEQKKGEPSPANSSHRQSDSKGQNSGENSGGGKQGGGQSAKQQGNDSAGSQTAGDMGAGTAQEKGGGEKGSKAGDQQKAAGKTGKSGDEAGEGSASRGGNDPGAAGAKADQQSKGEEGDDSQKKSDSDRRAKGGGRGSDPVGGKDDNEERFQNATEAGASQEADAANLEYARKATEMVLKRLKDEEHNPDPELLDKLGWSREDLAEFLRRWDALQKSANETPAGRRELDEALQSLGLRDPASKKRAGGKTSDSQRDLRDAGNRSGPPPRYRDLFDAFRKGSARSTP